MSQAPMSLMDFVKAAKAQIEEITPEQLERMIASTPDLLVLDVREPGEYEQGHIRDAMLVPRGILEAAADLEYPKHQPALVEARDRPVVIYCATGGRSALAAATLKQMGFAHVASLAGGITRWQQEDRPLVREARYV